MQTILRKTDALDALVRPLASRRETGARAAGKKSWAFPAWTTTLISHKIHRGGMRVRPCQTVSSTRAQAQVASVTVAGHSVARADEITAALQSQ